MLRSRRGMLCRSNSMAKADGTPPKFHWWTALSLVESGLSVERGVCLGNGSVGRKSPGSSSSRGIWIWGQRPRRRTKYFTHQRNTIAKAVTLINLNNLTNLPIVPSISLCKLTRNSDWLKTLCNCNITAPTWVNKNQTLKNKTKFKSVSPHESDEAKSKFSNKPLLTAQNVFAKF